ncbi:MAG: hypothetical protein AB7G17_10095 [Phycisphaerales bacterium]
MQRLKFRGVEQDEGYPEGVYAFPGSIRDILSRPDPRKMSPDELASSMEETLQRMEASLDLLRQESGAYPMSEYGRGDDDGPPRAA